MKKCCIIPLTPSQKNSLYSLNAKQAVLEKGKFWTPGQTITVGFMEAHNDMHLVKKAAEEWALYANLKFRFIAEVDQAIIRISFDEMGGAWSYMGNTALEIPKHKATMNLGWVDYATALHEFGHAIGFGHEHQNPEKGIEWNVEKVVEELSGPPNYWDIHTIYYNVLTPYHPSAVEGGDFDPDSIMLYFFPKDWTRNGVSTKQNTKLSAQDKFWAAKIYPPDKADDEILERRALFAEVFTQRYSLFYLPKSALASLADLIGVEHEEENRKSVLIQKVWNSLSSKQ